jgi:hypothetical protein
METKLFSCPPPVMLTTCGLPAAESEIVKVPAIEPAIAGVNTTVAVQLAPVFNEDPHVVAVTA